MTDEPDWALLDRCFGGDATREDRDALARWVAADASNAALVDVLRRAWAAVAAERPAVDDDRAWASLRARMHAATAGGAAPVLAPDAISPAERRPHSVPGALLTARRSSWRAPRYAIAAALLVAVGVGSWRAYDRGATARAVADAPERRYVTASGQHADVVLRDGTHVWLNVASRLRVASGYGITNRDVYLDGEGYFAVHHDGRHPFRVHARNAVSEDVGTAFSVRSYSDDTTATLLVAEGRVALRRAGAAHDASADAVRVELTRGQMARLDGSGRITVTNDVDLAAALGWRDGRLEFEEQPLAEVLREIERWYDLDIVLDDTSLARVPVTATLSDQSADQALAIVTASLGARYTRQGREVRVSAGHAR